MATVENGDTVRLKKIVQGRDFGQTVEILSGVDPDDEMVLNPPDSIADGTRCASSARSRLATPVTGAHRGPVALAALLAGGALRLLVRAALPACRRAHLRPNTRKATLEVAAPQDSAPRGPWWTLVQRSRTR